MTVVQVVASDLLNQSQAAILAGVSRQMISYAIKHGILPCFKLPTDPRARLVLRSDVLAYKHRVQRGYKRTVKPAAVANSTANEFTEQGDD